MRNGGTKAGLHRAPRGGIRAALATALLVAPAPCRAELNDGRAAFSRPRLELGARAGVAMPTGTNPSIALGPSAGAFALARLSWFAIGVTVDEAWLSWHATAPGFDEPAATVRIGLVGPLARIYLGTYDRVSTFLEAAGGLALFGSTVNSGDCKVGGMSFYGGAGVDARVASWFRLSFSADYATFLSAVSCDSRGRSVGGPPDPPLVAPGVELRIGGTYVVPGE